MDEVEAVYCIETCEISSTAAAIIIFLQIYLSLLLIPAVILAIISCKLKYKVVNESKELAAVTIVIAISQLVRISYYPFPTTPQIFVTYVLGEILNGFSSLLFATTCLLLLFLPKVSYTLSHDN